MAYRTGLPAVRRLSSRWRRWCNIRSKTKASSSGIAQFTENSNGPSSPQHFPARSSSWRNSTTPPPSSTGCGGSGRSTPALYGSTDLRQQRFRKLAPVDLNLFPGGFNNLNDAFLPLCIQAAQAAVERIHPGASQLLLIPENHTRNQFYLQNVAKLVSILRLTGLKIRVGTLLPEITGSRPCWSDQWLEARSSRSSAAVAAW